MFDSTPVVWPARSCIPKDWDGELYQRFYGMWSAGANVLRCPGSRHFSMIGVAVRAWGFAIVLPVAQKGMRVNQEQYEALVQRLEEQAERSPTVYRAKLGAMALLGYGYIAGVLTLLLVAVALLALLAVHRS